MGRKVLALPEMRCSGLGGVERWLEAIDSP